MADMFRVTPEDLQQHSNVMKSKTTEYKTLFTNLYRDVQTMQTTWKGDANQSFTNQINSYKSSFESMAQLLDLYANLLQTARTNYSQTEQNLSTKAKQI